MNIMEQNQQENRLNAATEFQKSLDQLEDILQEDTEDETLVLDSDSMATDIEEANTPIDLAAWEDAVADIERYFEEKGK
jgi:hypothetical protein